MMQQLEMKGMQGAMLKKKFPEVDLHMNSNIVISMDDKARMKSHYMKKYTDSIKSVNVKALDQRPAGTKALILKNQDQVQ